MTMTTNGHIPLADFYLLERTDPSLPKLDDLGSSILESLGTGHSRRKVTRQASRCCRGQPWYCQPERNCASVCGWLKAQGAQPFIFPAMGSHGGGTAEGQRKILEEYSVTEAVLGVEVRSSMETVL